MPIGIKCSPSLSRLRAAFGIVAALTVHLAIAASLGVWLFAADPTTAPATATAPLKPAKSGPEDVAAMKAEIDQLKADIELLRKENQQLRRVLSDRAHGPTNMVSSATVSTNAASAPNVPKYWLTAGGKRHNRDCRYFQKGDGRAGDAREGTACKLCGG